MKRSVGDVFISNSVSLVVDDGKALYSSGSVTYCWDTTRAMELSELLHALEPIALACRTISRDITSLRTGDIIMYDGKPAMFDTDNALTPICIFEDGREAVLGGISTASIVLFREQLVYLLNLLLHRDGKLDAATTITTNDVTGLLILREVK